MASTIFPGYSPSRFMICVCTQAKAHLEWAKDPMQALSCTWACGSPVCWRLPSPHGLSAPRRLSFSEALLQLFCLVLLIYGSAFPGITHYLGHCNVTFSRLFLQSCAGYLLMASRSHSGVSLGLSCICVSRWEQMASILTMLNLPNQGLDIIPLLLFFDFFHQFCTIPYLDLINISLDLYTTLPFCDCWYKWPVSLIKKFC